MKTSYNTGVPLYHKKHTSLKYVCFSCRLCFHKPFSTENLLCNCGTKMMFAGFSFRAPRRRNIKEWKKLEVLIRDGVIFQAMWGVGHIPNTVNEVKKSRRELKRKDTYAMRLPNGKRILTSSRRSYNCYVIPE